VKFSINIDEGAFRSQLEKLTIKKIKKGCRKGMSHVAAAVLAAAVPLTPVKTANLRRSERWRVEGEGFDVVAVLEAHASYAGFVHDGTGLYGPLKRKIEVWCKPPKLHTATFKYASTIMGVSVKAKRTITRGSRSGGGQPYFRESKGMEGTPFFKLAIIKLESQLPWIFLRGFFSAID